MLFFCSFHSFFSFFCYFLRYQPIMALHWFTISFAVFIPDKKTAIYKFDWITSMWLPLNNKQKTYFCILLQYCFVMMIKFKIECLYGLMWVLFCENYSAKTLKCPRLSWLEAKTRIIFWVCSITNFLNPCNII